MDKAHVTALRRAIDIAGSQARLAEKLRAFPSEKCRKVRQQHVSYWLKDEVLLDAEWWPAFEFATGGAVTRKDLRPDVFSDHVPA